MEYDERFGLVERGTAGAVGGADDITGDPIFYFDAME